MMYQSGLPNGNAVFIWKLHCHWLRDVWQLYSSYTGPWWWQETSSTPCCDFWPLTVISDDLSMISDVFVKLSQKKNIVEKIESIKGAPVERSSPSWVCIPQKSLAVTHDFWNTNSLGLTPFRTGAHDGFSIVWSCSGILRPQDQEG